MNAYLHVCGITYFGLSRNVTRKKGLKVHQKWLFFGSPAIWTTMDFSAKRERNCCCSMRRKETWNYREDHFSTIQFFKRTWGKKVDQGNTTPKKMSSRGIKSIGHRALHHFLIYGALLFRAAPFRCCVLSPSINDKIPSLNITEK